LIRSISEEIDKQYDADMGGDSAHSATKDQSNQIFYHIACLLKRVPELPPNNTDSVPRRQEQ